MTSLIAVFVLFLNILPSAISQTVEVNSDYPYVARVVSSSGSGYKICQGILIRVEWILSTNFCTINTTIHYACMGEDTITDVDCLNKIYVSMKVFHETLSISMLMLDKPFTLGKHVKLAPLIERNANEKTYLSSCSIVGWQTIRPLVIRMVHSRATMNGTCKVFKPMICALTEQNICPGNAGVPLVCKNKVMGILMYANTLRCNDNRQTLVAYENIKLLYPFMEKHIRKNYRASKAEDTVNYALFLIFSVFLFLK